MSQYIREEVKKQNWIKPTNTYLYMDEVIYMNKAGRDSDNLKKLLQDSITESNVVWSDDKFCLPRTQKILIDKYNPRIELVISEVEYIGIFDTIQDLINFKNQFCYSCTKHNNGSCKYLCNAIEGRIQQEINKNNNYICIKYNKGNIK